MAGPDSKLSQAEEQHTTSTGSVDLVARPARINICDNRMHGYSSPLAALSLLPRSISQPTSVHK